MAQTVKALEAEGLRVDQQWWLAVKDVDALPAAREC